MIAAGLPVPPAVRGIDATLDALKAWGSGFLKPGFDARGRGVLRVTLEKHDVALEDAQGTRAVSREALEPWLANLERTEPYIFQREVRLAPGPFRGL